ncbi:MAG: ABC transporter substrate-binding protein [Tissierellia bacterium]|nr:ABC transporter substrate-binding protein [Tissierellia bacterium]
MKNYKIFRITVLMAVFALVFTGCTKSNENKVEEKETTEVVEAENTETENVENNFVEITDAHGTISVPINPKNVVALDNRTFETLSDWGIELAAVPKAVMPDDSPYVADESVEDIGDHSEPNLEIIAAVEPELVIVGQRFAKYYEDIKALVPNAAVIDVNLDVSGENGPAGENLINGLKNSTVVLGQIFDKNEEAEKLIAEFDNSIETAKAVYNNEDTIMSIVVSGGNIGFSAPTSGRVWGPMYEIFDWKSSLVVEGSTSDHKGDDISVEAIAQSNPDWIFVLDRDAAVSSSEDSVPAKDVIENSPALKNTTAVTKEQIVYAPNDTYTNESIQTYIELFENIADALGK